MASRDEERVFYYKDVMHLDLITRDSDSPDKKFFGGVIGYTAIFAAEGSREGGASLAVVHIETVDSATAFSLDRQDGILEFDELVQQLGPCLDRQVLVFLGCKAGADKPGALRVSLTEELARLYQQGESKVEYLLTTPLTPRLKPQPANGYKTTRYWVIDDMRGNSVKLHIPPMPGSWHTIQTVDLQELPKLMAGGGNLEKLIKVDTPAVRPAEPRVLDHSLAVVPRTEPNRQREGKHRGRS